MEKYFKRIEMKTFQMRNLIRMTIMQAKRTWRDNIKMKRTEQQTFDEKKNNF